MGDDVTDVCQKTLHDWRRMNWAVMIVDLKSVYLQICIVRKLWIIN